EALDDQTLEPGQHGLALVALNAEVQPVLARGVRAEPDKVAALVDNVRAAMPRPRVRRVQEDVLGIGPDAGGPDCDLRRRQVGAGLEWRARGGPRGRPRPRRARGGGEEPAPPRPKPCAAPRVRARPP